MWCPDLNPEGEIVEAIVKTLIYGVKSVSAQSEYALEQLADIAETYDKEGKISKRLNLKRVLNRSKRIHSKTLFFFKAANL